MTGRKGAALYRASEVVRELVELWGIPLPDAQIEEATRDVLDAYHGKPRRKRAEDNKEAPPAPSLPAPVVARAPEVTVPPAAPSAPLARGRQPLVGVDDCYCRGTRHDYGARYCTRRWVEDPEDLRSAFGKQDEDAA